MGNGLIYDFYSIPLFLAGRKGGWLRRLCLGVPYQKRLRGRSERQWVKSAEIARIKTTRRVVVVFF